MITLIWSLTHACPSGWIRRFEKAGIRTFHIPFVRVQLVPDCTSVDSSLKRLRSYDGILFTSRHAVRFTQDRLRALGLRMSTPIYCVGSSTAKEIQEHGWRPVWVADEYSGRGLSAKLANDLPAGSHLLFLRSTRSDAAPWTMLEEKGIVVHGIDLYSPRLITYGEGARIRETLRKESILITFGSPSAVDAWLNIWDSSDQAARMLESSFVCAIGETTAQALNRIRISPDIIPSKPTAENLCLAISRAVKRGIHEFAG